MKRFLLPLLPLMAASCATLNPAPPLPAIADSDLRSTIAVLASDEFEGRLSGSPAEAKTTGYIVDRFRKAGLEGGLGGGEVYLQPFEMGPMTAPKGPPPKSGLGGQYEFMVQRAKLGRATSHNVVAVARGRRPDGQVVLMMAHWDHLGICRPAGEKDRVCNGAVDNASGVAALLAVADRVTAMKLDRDVWFVLTGGEEWGLFGAAAFAARPPVPLGSIAAAFNLDTIAVSPAGMPVAMVAPPHSPLVPVVRKAAAALNRAWDGDDEAAPFIKRQDGYELSRKGVPMVMAGGSFSDLKLLQRFLSTNYHGPKDELTPDLDLGGAVDDANLHLVLARLTATRKFKARALR